MTFQGMFFDKNIVNIMYTSPSFRINLLIYAYFSIGVVVRGNARNLTETSYNFPSISQRLTTEYPFPFISFSETGEPIVEPEMVALDSSADSGNRLICQNTVNLLEGQSIQFRSPVNYLSSPQLPSKISVTCFNSPPGTNISIKCDVFSVNCNRDRFDISSGENGDTFCGNDPLSEQISGSNKMKIVFGRRGIGNSSFPARFRCHVSHIGSDSSRETHLGSRGRCSCGRRNIRSRIVGGVRAEPQEFPWRCYIKVPDGTCGCTLISNRWIMTAAHCTEGVRRVNIILGAHTIGHGARVTTLTSRKVINHPRYRGIRDGLRNDIALIEMSRRIRPSREISPVCLPFNMARRTFCGLTAVTSGWGRKISGRDQPGSDTLRKVTLPVSNQMCTRVLGGWFTRNMICGFHSRRGTCFGDSGTSMDFRRNSRYYAIGVTSWGHPNESCQGTSVFTRVTSYLNWIQATTRERFCRI